MYAAAPKLTDEQERYCRMIDDEREIYLNGGTLWNGHWYDTDERGRNNITAVVAILSASAELPANFTWRTMDNENLPFTGDDIKHLAAAIFQHTTACYTASWKHKDMINGYTTIEELYAHNIEDFWPSIKDTQQ